ncbi:MAG: DUF493 domain-containing protein [Pseudomonadota bacterium]
MTERADGAGTQADVLFDFPCDFPIKIMGENTPELETHVRNVVQQQGLSPLSLVSRTSAKGNYLALTLTVRAQSRAQLDALYIALGVARFVKALL